MAWQYTLQKELWYFTFGNGSILRNNFVVVPGTYDEARTKIAERYGNKWAFQYSQKDFEGQPEKYGLTEVEFGTENKDR